MKKNRGFTLIEVLVSIALLSLLGLISLSGLSTSLNYNSEISERSKFINRLEKTHTLLSQDLIQSVDRISRNSRGDFANYAFFGQSQDSSTDVPFLSFSINTFSKDQSQGSVRWVEYFLIEGKINRKEYFYADRTEDTPTYNQTLLSKVEGVELRFYKDNSWTNQWPDETDLFDSGLPKIVEIIFRIESLGTIKKLFILSNMTL